MHNTCVYIQRKHDILPFAIMLIDAMDLMLIQKMKIIVAKSHVCLEY